MAIRRREAGIYTWQEQGRLRELGLMSLKDWQGVNGEQGIYLILLLHLEMAFWCGHWHWGTAEEIYFGGGQKVGQMKICGTGEVS